MAIELSLMTMSDYDAVLALWEKCEGVVVSESDSYESIERYLLRNPHSCFVAREGNNIVGAVLSGHDGRRGLLHHLAVAAEHRRRGIGKMLVDRCLEQLKAEGIPKCYIIVLNDNEKGQEFWRSMGWKDFGGRATVLTREC